MPVALGCDRERDSEGRSGEQFLTELFEHELCSECGADEREHLAIPTPFGGWHAMCLRIDPEMGPTSVQEEWMPTVPADADGLAHCLNSDCAAGWSPSVPYESPGIEPATDNQIRECPLCKGMGLEWRVRRGERTLACRPRLLVHDGPRGIEL